MSLTKVRPHEASLLKNVVEATRWVLSRWKVHSDVVNFIIVPYVKNNLFRRLNGLRLLQHSVFTIHAAKECNKSVIIHRNGMTKNNHMLYYDGKDVIPGQWLKGKRVIAADLSPNGEYAKLVFRFPLSNMLAGTFCTVCNTMLQEVT